MDMSVRARSSTTIDPSPCVLGQPHRVLPYGDARSCPLDKELASPVRKRIGINHRASAVITAWHRHAVATIPVPRARDFPRFNRSRSG
jgi:hypothetical protein